VPLPSAILFDVGGTVLREVWFDLERGLRAVVRDDVGRIAARWRDTTTHLHLKNRDVLLAQWLIDEVSDLETSTVEKIEDTIWPDIVSLVPAAGIQSILKACVADDVRVAALSNASFSARILHNELHRHGIGDAFEFVLTSGDFGVRKPARAVFDDAVQRLHVSPKDVWFIGDTFEEDIVGATAAGLDAYWLTSAEHTSHPADRCVRDWPMFSARYQGAAR
jgi:FMN phosphatase YigB (HAD superfamily)